MTELAERQQIVHVITGEVLEVTVPNVAAYLAELRDLERNLLRDEKNAATAYLLAEAERLGAKTFRAGSHEVKVGGGVEYEWDIEELDKLRDVGLPEERWGDLVETVITYKVNQRVAKQLASANPDYAKILERARTEIEKPTYVSIR